MRTLEKQINITYLFGIDELCKPINSMCLPSCYQFLILVVQRNYIVDHVSYKVILFATQQLCQQPNGFFVKSVDLLKDQKWNNKDDINQWWI